MSQILRFLWHYHSRATVHITNNRLSTNQSMNMRHSMLHDACLVTWYTASVWRHATRLFGNILREVCLVTCYMTSVWWHATWCLFGDMLHDIYLVTCFMTSVWWHATGCLFGDMVHICLVTCCMTSVWWHATGCLFDDMSHNVCSVTWYTSVWWHAAWRLFGDLLDLIGGLTGRKISSYLKHQVAYLLLTVTWPCDQKWIMTSTCQLSVSTSWRKTSKLAQILSVFKFQHAVDPTAHHLWTQFLQPSTPVNLSGT